MYRQVVKNIDYHNPFDVTSYGRKVFLLALLCALIFSINIHAYVFLLVITVFIVFDFTLYVYITCGHIKHIWTLFIGTKLRTNLQTYYYVRNSPYHSTTAKKKYADCISWLETMVGTSYYLLTPGDYIVFFWRSDAVWFKMIWGGEEGFVLPPLKEENGVNKSNVSLLEKLAQKSFKAN